MQLVALLFEMTDYYSPDNIFKQLKSQINNFSSDGIIRDLFTQPETQLPACNGNLRELETKSAVYTHANVVKNKLSNPIYGFSLNFNNVKKLKFLYKDFFSTAEVARLISIFGRSAAAIYAINFLLLIWLAFFFFLGFISLERSRVIVMLLLILTTFLFIGWSYYELYELNHQLCRVKHFKQKHPKVLVLDFVSSVEDEFYVNLKKLKKEFDLGHLFITDRVPFFFKKEKAWFEYFKSFFIELKNEKKAYTVSLVEVSQSITIESLKQLTQTPLSQSASLKAGSGNYAVFSINKMPNISEEFSYLTTVKSAWSCKQSWDFCSATDRLSLLGDQSLIQTLGKPKPYNHVSRYWFIDEKQSTKDKARDIFRIVIAIKTQHNLHNPINFVTILSATFGGCAASLAGCYGLNYKVMRKRRLLWMSTKLNNYTSSLRKLSKKMYKSYIYHPWGGCGYIEFSSIEQPTFFKKIRQPKTWKECLSFSFWYNQFQKAIYSRVSTTTLWVSLILCPLLLSFNSLQHKLMAVLLLLLYAIIKSTANRGVLWRTTYIRVTAVKQFVGRFIQEHLSAKLMPQAADLLPRTQIFKRITVTVVTCTALVHYAAIQTTGNQVTGLYFIQAFYVLTCLALVLVLTLSKIQSAFLGNKQLSLRVTACVTYSSFISLNIGFFAFKILSLLFTSIYIEYLVSITVAVSTFLVFLNFLANKKISPNEYSCLFVWEQLQVFLSAAARFLVIVCLSFVFLKPNPLLAILIPYLWIVYATALQTIKYFIVLCNKASEANSTDLRYSIYIQFPWLWLVALLSVCACAYMGDNVSLTSYVLQIFTIMVWLSNPSHSERVQLFGGLSVCIVSTMLFLLFLDVDFVNLPDLCTLPNKFKYVSPVFFVWVWSYTRLGLMVTRLKILELFLITTTLVLPAVLIIVYEVTQIYKEAIIPTVFVITFSVQIAQLLLSTCLTTYNKRSNNSKVLTQHTIKVVDSGSVRLVLFSYILICFLVAYGILLTNQLVDSFMVSIIIVLLVFKSIVSALVILIVTGAVRTGFIADLRGVLVNLRFLKKTFNIFIFLIILFFTYSLYLLLYI